MRVEETSLGFQNEDLPYESTGREENPLETAKNAREMLNKSLPD